MHVCGFVYIVYVYVVYMSTYMYERMLDWVHMCVCTYLYISIIDVCMYISVYMCMCPCACVGVNHVFMFICMCWLRATAFRTCSVRSEPSYRRPGPDPNSCSLWTWYTSDSKTGLWDDP